MEKTLGILVSSSRHLENIIKLCNAAKKRGIEVTLFFTHKGTLLTQDPRFSELDGLKISACKIGFESLGLKPPVSGIEEKGYSTQAMHAELINNCERYVVF